MLANVKHKHFQKYLPYWYDDNFWKVSNIWVFNNSKYRISSCFTRFSVMFMLFQFGWLFLYVKASNLFGYIYYFALCELNSSSKVFKTHTKSQKNQRNLIMAVVPVELINKLFHDVVQNAKNIGDLMKEITTIDQIWYMLVSLISSTATSQKVEVRLTFLRSMKKLSKHIQGYF